MAISQGPRIAFLDIETAPIIAAVWQLRDIQNVVWTERETFILCFSVKWSGENKIHTYSLPDYPLYRRNKTSDKALCSDLWNVLDEADVVIAHNAPFDVKKSQARLVTNKFPPPSPFKTIDTLSMVRKSFKFDSGKLDHVARYLGIGRKLKHTGADMWRDCLDGDLDAFKMLAEYNAHDVYLLEHVFEKLKAWGTLPDLRPYSTSAGENSCPICFSNHVQRRGVAVARTRRYQRFQCQECTKWFSGKKAEPDKVAA